MKVPSAKEPQSRVDGRVFIRSWCWDPDFRDRHLRKKIWKIFVSRQKNQSQLWIPRKPRKIGVWVSGAEIQTSAVDTRIAVWVSTPEKISKICLGKTRNFSRKFRGVSAPALDKNPAVTCLYFKRARPERGPVSSSPRFQHDYWQTQWQWRVHSVVSGGFWGRMCKAVRARGSVAKNLLNTTGCSMQTKSGNAGNTRTCLLLRTKNISTNQFGPHKGCQSPPEKQWHGTPL